MLVMTKPQWSAKNDCFDSHTKQVFQQCFDIGGIQDEWTKSWVNPLPKSAENDDKVEWISLLNCI